MNSPTPVPPSSAKRSFLPRSLWSILGVILLAGVLAGIALPVFNRTCVKGDQTMALARAKQVGLALKLYAGDHDGVYPAGVNIYGEKIHRSNDAFRSLFPTYAQTETIFGNRLSAYQTRIPDNIIEPFTEILRPGENVLSYVEGLTDASNPATPIIADGGDGSGRGLYVSDPHALGGVWKGQRAIVIRLDNSGALEGLTLAVPANARYIMDQSPGKPAGNLLGADRLGKGTRLLEPAIP